MQFPAVFRALLTRISRFLVDILSRYQFLPHPTLTISMQMWTNSEAHIFRYHPQTGDPLGFACGTVLVYAVKILTRQTGVTT